MDQNTTTEPDDDVIAALERLERTEASLRLRLRERLQVSNTDIVALQHIDRITRRGRTITATELSPVLGISVPAIAALVKRLEARGLIVKATVSDNRRVRHLSLSDTARSDLLDAMSQTREKLETLIGELNDVERRRTVAILDRVTDALDGGAPLTIPAPIDPT